MESILVDNVVDRGGTIFFSWMDWWLLLDRQIFYWSTYWNDEKFTSDIAVFEDGIPELEAHKIILTITT